MKKTKNNVILLSIVSLINDFSSKMILPILPLFIKELGGLGLAVGLVSSIGESISSFLKVLSGYWSDKLGKRKPFVILGYLVSSISKLFFFFATSWPFVLVLRAIERTGKGLRSAPRDAMLASSSEKRGKTFGIHRAFDSGGAVIGSLVAFALFWYLGLSLRNIFLIAGIVALFSVIPVFFTKEIENGKASKTKVTLSFKKMDKSLKLFIVAATIFALGNFSYMFFVLKAQEAFTNRFYIAIPILLFALYQLFYSILAIPSGILADKIGKDKVLIMGYSLFAFVALGFVYFNSLNAYIILFILYGIMFAFVNSNERAYVSDLSDKEVRGTALGTFYTLTSFAALPAGIVGGLLFDLNPSYTFIYAVVTSIVAVLVFTMHKFK